MPTVEPRRRRMAIAAALTLGLALSACAGAEPDSSSSEGGGDEPRTLSFGVQAPPNSLDPAQLHDGQQRYVWGALYDTLVFADATGEISPNAAEKRWEYSEDGLTLTLSLREGMTFSGGDPVTAASVQTTLERTRTTAGPQQANLAAIASIEAPDDATVVIELEAPDPNLLVALSYGAGVIAAPETFEGEGGSLDPVGSGPYTLNRERTVDGSSYTLERRDDYWNAEAFPFDTIEVRAIQDRTALFNALMSGELDAGTVDASQRPQAESSGYELTEVVGSTVSSIVIADRAGEVAEPLADVRVRQAINLALDRQGMIDGILGGSGEAASQLFNQSSPAFISDLEGRYDFDVEAARALMAEAGYAEGFSLTMPASLMVMTYQPTIAQALGDIGIQVEWEPVPAQQSGQTTRWGMYYNVGAVAAPTRTSALYYAPGGSQNPFQYEDETMNGLLSQLQGETDPDAAAEIAQEMNQYASDQAWFAPMIRPSVTWATADGIAYVGDENSPQDVRVFSTR